MAGGAVSGQGGTDSLPDQRPGYWTEFPGLDGRVKIRKILAEEHKGNGTVQIKEQPINGLPDNGKVPVVTNAVPVAVVTQEVEIG